MILHITTDNKFINYTIKQFEAVNPERNVYLVDIPTKSYKIQYIKREKNVIVGTRQSKQYVEVLRKLETFDLVIMHSLNSHRVRIINNAPKHVLFAWLPWGADLFPLVESYDLYQTRTKRLMWKSFLFERLKKDAQDLYHILKLRKSKISQKREAINRTQYFLSRIDNFKVICNQFPNLTHLEYIYYSIEDTLGVNKDKLCNGNNILIGNSATAENNHLEILTKLKLLDIGQRKIVIPLSYGKKEYGRQIATIGQKFFPSNLEALIEWMPMEEYNSKVRECGVVIMNHKRTQAFGNILTSLWFGAKLYINEGTPLYELFKNIGLHVFSISRDLVPENKDVFKRLPKEAVAQNREILWNEFSYESSLKKVQKIVDEVKRKG